MGESTLFLSHVQRSSLANLNLFAHCSNTDVLTKTSRCSWKKKILNVTQTFQQLIKTTHRNEIGIGYETRLTLEINQLSTYKGFFWLQKGTEKMTTFFLADKFNIATCHSFNVALFCCNAFVYCFAQQAENALRQTRNKQKFC